MTRDVLAALVGRGRKSRGPRPRVLGPFGPVSVLFYRGTCGVSRLVSLCSSSETTHCAIALGEYTPEGIELAWHARVDYGFGRAFAAGGGLFERYDVGGDVSTALGVVLDAETKRYGLPRRRSGITCVSVACEVVQEVSGVDVRAFTPEVLRQRMEKGFSKCPSLTRPTPKY